MKRIIRTVFVTGLLFSSMVFAVAADTDVFLYKTIPGDSLWNITERHLTDMKLWTALKKENNLPDNNHLDPGTIIKIPNKWLKMNKATASLVNAMGEVTLTSVEGDKIALDEETKQNSKIPLFEGMHIATGDDGLATVLFVDGSRLLLQSNSELVLQDLIALGDGSLSNIRLKLGKGRVESRVHSSVISNTNYEVSTPVATTSVRGTDFRVTTGDGEQSIAEVLKGRVVAMGAESSQSIELNEGEGTFVGMGDTAPVKLILPEAPEFTTIPKLIEHVPIKLVVEEIEGITGFDTSIVPVGDDPKNAVSSQTTEGNVLAGADLPDGRYQMYVSAIDAKGLTGKPAMYEFILNARPFSPQMSFPGNATEMVEAQLKFNWNKVNDEAKSYHLQVAKDQAFRELVIDETAVPENSYKSSTLMGSGAYYWRVASVDMNQKRGPFTEPQIFRVLLETPNLQTANVATSDITLRWDASEVGTQYTIQVATDPNFATLVLEKTLDNNALILTEVKPSTYYFRIQTIAPDTFVSQWGQAQKFIIPDNTEVPVKVSLSEQ